ncbi:MAG: patatin-like phospholipase family protein [candidate division WOR-3 bacterium]|nr:MAG: patatin-like phospholipase family protein [candidate division WOR-3 bacterium]
MLSALLLAVFTVNSIPLDDTSSTDTQYARIGISLSGGAFHGLAHIGVLKVLDREGIIPSCIAGSSMGSLVGGIYAAGYSPAAIESIVVNASLSEFFGSTVPFGARYLPERQQSERYTLVLSHRNFIPKLPSGVISLQNFEFLLMDLLSDIEFQTNHDFDNLPIPYRAVAVDLMSGNLVTLKNGRLEQAIRASIAIPGAFPPETIDTLALVDGGVHQFLPVQPLIEFEPDLIIASTTVRVKPEADHHGLIDVLSRTIDLMTMADYREQLKLADIVIEPNVDPFLPSDLNRASELIEAGERAAEAALPEIRAKLNGRKVRVKPELKFDRIYPYVSSIQFEGLKVTSTSTVRHLVRTKRGTRLNFDMLHEDMIMLYNTGLFSDINYKLVFHADDSVQVVYQTKESQYGFYALGVRYDNSDNLILGIEGGQGNLWGTGASIRAALCLGNPRALRLGLTGTRLFAFPVGYRIDMFRGSIDRPYFANSTWITTYNTTYHGGLIEAGYILGNNAFFKIGICAREVIYRLPPVPIFDSIPANEWVVGPTLRMEYNNYDDLHLPNKGTSYVAEIIYSTERLNASADFSRIDFSFDHYIPLSSRVLVHPGLDLGISHGDLAWDYHFHTGGNNFIGYENGYFTTRNRVVLRLSLEYRILNLLDLKDYPVYLQLISNVATFERPDGLFSNGNWVSELHWGTGIGIRTNTPIGPLNLSVGIGDIKKDDLLGARVNYYISIGKEFRYTK